MKSPECPKPRKIPFHPYIIVNPSDSPSVILPYHKLKTHQNSLVIMGRKHGKLLASIHGKSTIHPFFISYIYCCTCCPSSVLSVHPADVDHQENPDKFLVLIMGRNLVELPVNITLTLHNANFPEKTPGNSNG